MDTLTEKFLFKPLRIPSNWCVHWTKFFEISPNLASKLQIQYPGENYYIHYFDQYMLRIEYGEDRRWALEISWIDLESTRRYLLSLSDESWTHKSPTYEKMTADEITNENEDSIKLETHSLEEITDAVNEMMLHISLENGDYENYPTNLQLQNLRPFHNWRFTKNEFFDIEPKDDLTAEEWKLFGENLLRLEAQYDSKVRIEMGWFPAFEPSGSYKAKLINENLENILLEEFSTRHREEITEYINEAMENKVNNLSQKRTQSERDRRRQMKLQIQRNQKV